MRHKKNDNWIKVVSIAGIVQKGLGTRASLFGTMLITGKRRAAGFLSRLGRIVKMSNHDLMSLGSLNRQSIFQSSHHLQAPSVFGAIDPFSSHSRTLPCHIFPSQI